MVRVAEGPLPRDRAAAEQPRHAVNHADLQRLARRQRRQDAGQPLRQHRLAGARRADHEEVVISSRGDLERALGRLLALDVGEVGGRRLGAALRRLGRGQNLQTLEMVDQREQARRRQDLDLAGPGGLAAGRRRADQAQPRGMRADGGRQHPRDRRDRAVERQLAQRCIAAHLLARQHLHRDQQAERDRQVEVAAFLLHVGRREVHRDPFRRQAEAERAQGRPHPLAALADRLVGKADDREGRQPVRHGDLDVDSERLDALKGNGIYMGRHYSTSPRTLPIHRRGGRGKGHCRRGAVPAAMLTKLHPFSQIVGPSSPQQRRND